MGEDPFDPGPGDIVPAPPMSGYHTIINELANVLGYRLWRHPEFPGDLLLTDCRLVLGNLDKDLEPGHFPLAPENR